MKKKMVIMIAFFLALIIGYFLGAGRSARSPYDNTQLLDKLYAYVSLIENIDFKYAKIKGNKIYYSSNDFGSLLDYMDGRTESGSVGQIEIPIEVQDKAKGLRKVYLVQKLDGQIYFVLSGFLNHESGVFFTRKKDIRLHFRGIRGVFDYHGEGSWYYYFS
jgi:hypothetical protein